MTTKPKSSKLALAIKAKYATPEMALAVLGLPPELLAQDRKSANDDELEGKKLTLERERTARAEAVKEVEGQIWKERAEEKYSKILHALNGKVPADIYTKISDIITGKSTGAQDSARVRRHPLASDAARHDDYLRRFPMTARIGHDPY